MTKMTSELCFKTASELARLVRTREISVMELVRAHLAQIERVNPSVNAICTFVPEKALADADRAERASERGPLHGLPIAIKDLVPTRGIRTTFGSRIYRDFVPEEDAPHVQTLTSAGAIVVGKTNVPELGAGSQTFNEIFGATRNPYDLSKTCGGSSGGAAVALACGMIPIADGSDLGGSLRNPASFCNVVGFRPTTAEDELWVTGPMARTVEDAALLFSVMCRTELLTPDVRGARIAWSRDLGRYPVDPEVNAVCESARPVFTDLGFSVEDAHPDLSDVDEIFQVLRAQIFAARHAEDLRLHRSLMKDTVVWNVEKGLALDAAAIANARANGDRLRHRTREFFERYRFLVLPTVQVPPFSVDLPYVEEVAGVRMATYVDWMATCYAISVTAHPAVSVPCAFTAGGLPVGLQIVGRYGCDFEVLALARAFERATSVGERRPAAAL